MKEDMTAEIRKIDGLLQRRQLREARTMCDSLLMRHPDSAEGWLLAARVHQLSGDYGGMLDAARGARLPSSPRTTSRASRRSRRACTWVTSQARGRG